MRNPVFTSTAIRLGFADEQRVDQLTVPSTAESIAVFAPAASGMLGAKIAADLGLPLSAHEEREFTGREYKMRALQSVRDRSVYVVQSLFGDSRGSANDRLCQLLFFVGALKDAGAERVTACVPYLAYARQDRRSEAHDPITARYIAQLFEAMGVDRVLVLEVHNLAAFDNAFRCRTVHLEAAALFVRHFAAQSVDHEFAVVSPDIGGVKRARHFQEQLEQAVGHAVNFALMDKKRSRGGVTGFIDQTFATGVTLSSWLQQPAVGASTTPGQIPVNIVRDDFAAVKAPAQRWMYAQTTGQVAPDPKDPAAFPLHYTFDTPVGGTACGRGVFSDFHVEDASNNPSTGVTFPAECTPGAMTPQEKLLEFMLFDLTSCVSPPICTPLTCAAFPAGTCGQQGDGCGGLTPDCGTCTPPQTCGGGGAQGHCGAADAGTCPPKSCAQQGVECGVASDGCGNVLTCPACPIGQTCNTTTGQCVQNQ